MNFLVLQSLSAWAPLGYGLVFIGMMVEGDVILFSAAFLANQGFFNIGLIVPIIAGGVLLGDALWYKLGEHFNKNPDSMRNRWVSKIAKPFDNHLVHRPLHTIFISKFTYGLHHIILMRAGALNIGLCKFMRDDALSSFFWIVVVGGLGYFSSVSFALVKQSLRFAEVALLIGVVGFFVLQQIITWLLKKTL